MSIGVPNEGMKEVQRQVYNRKVSPERITGVDFIFGEIVINRRRDE